MQRADHIDPLHATPAHTITLASIEQPKNLGFTPTFRAHQHD
ncbi:hypothetical protein [Rathayibacter toxicus]|nr:hypothetical protein [Rathayibacter toxicus]